jgi:signal peptidase II
MFSLLCHSPGDGPAVVSKLKFGFAGIRIQSPVLRSGAILLSFIVFGLDLLTKWWVQTTRWLHYYPVIDDFFKINYVRNEGIAFGFFHSLESEWKWIVLTGMGIIAILVVLYYIWSTPSDQVLLIVSLGLLLGGILGNFVDRILHRHVTDFLELHWKDQFSWPTFNLADAAITCGVFLIFLTTFLSGSNGTSREDETLHA